jgi:urease accessory protein
MSTKARAVAIASGMTVLAPLPAFAHPMKGVGDFYAGMLHPVTTVETVLPIIVLSLLAGQQRREAAIPLLVAFPAALVFGALMATLGNAPSNLGIVELILTAGFGVMVALACRTPRWLLVGLGVTLGVSAGWKNAAEISGDMSSFRFIAGLALVGLLLIVYGIGLVRYLTATWTQIAVRVVGSWIAAASILVLGLK